MRTAWAALAVVGATVGCCAALPLAAALVGALTTWVAVGSLASLAVLALGVGLALGRRGAPPRGRA